MNDSSIGKDGPTQQDYQLAMQAYLAQQLPGSSVLNFDSSISPSQQLASLDSYNSNSPRLDSTMAYYAMKAKINDAATAFLEGWAKALAEAKEIMEAYLKSPAYLDKLQSVSTATMAKEEIEGIQRDKMVIKSPAMLDAFISTVPLQVAFNFLTPGAFINSPAVEAILSQATKVDAASQNAAYGTGAVAPNNNAVNPLAADAPTKSLEIGPEHFLAASLIIGAGVIALSQTTASVNGNLNVETKLIQDTWSSVFPMQEQVNAVLLASWFSAMWGTLTYQVSLQNVDKYTSAEGKGAKKYDVDFAKTYALALIGMLNTPQFNRIMVEVIIKSQEAAPADKRQDVALLLLQGKIVLLSVALAMVSKLDVAGKDNEGWFNEVEFEGMLRGTTKLDHLDINSSAGVKARLIAEINAAAAQLPPGEAEALFENLKAYLRSNPSVEKMLDQQQLFRDVLPEAQSSGQFNGVLINKTPA